MSWDTRAGRDVGKAQAYVLVRWPDPERCTTTREPPESWGLSPVRAYFCGSDAPATRSEWLRYRKGAGIGPGGEGLGHLVCDGCGLQCESRAWRDAARDGRALPMWWDARMMCASGRMRPPDRAQRGAAG